MTEARKLMVGLDLSDQTTQLSCCCAGKEGIVPIGRLLGREREYECPTVLSYHPQKKEWLFGTEAILEADKGNVLLFHHMIQQISQKQEVTAGKMTITGTDALTRFFVKLLSCLKEYYPNETILKLVVTVADKNDNLVHAIVEAMQQIGIDQDRLVIQPHRQSYMYYALSQKRELWMNDVGLFEFGREGMFYSQIHIDRRKVPYIVGVQQKDLTDTLNWDMMEHDNSFRMEYAFINLANTQLHKQMVTTIYVTGEGFEGEWANIALKQLCTGRRVFRGSNLFTKGACYAAREFAGQGTMDEFLFLDEEMIYSNISVRVYRDAKMQEVMLAKAGTPWKDIDVSIDVIPDGEEELQMTTQNVIRHETKVHLLSLEGFEERPNKMTRFTVRLRFADASHCIVTLKDNGFGEFCPSSNRIWERYLSL